MAKQNARRTIDMKRRKDPAIRKVGMAYVIMGAIYLIFIAFNMIVENLVYINTRNQYDANMDASNSIADIRKEFSKVNLNILSLTSAENEAQRQGLLESVRTGLNELNEKEKEFDGILLDGSEIAKRRFTHVKYALTAYDNQVTEILESLTDENYADVASIYTQELNPLWISTNEMLGGITEIISVESGQNRVKVAIQHGVAQGSLVAMLVILIIMLVLLGNRQVKTLIAVQQQTRELNEASARLTKSRKKLLDSAMMNILTGMKNRYALDESLSQLINNAQFNIAVFDVDNFRVFNDMYGYEVGDEYLATIAERLKEEYSDYAEMFNITGNEFCAVFYEHVSDVQAQQLSEQIRQAIGQPTMVAGSILLQATVSASLYHYLPSDNLDVNTLLMKMDSALHAAKRDGGNRMYQIQ